jgi:hypothetical protein
MIEKRCPSCEQVHQARITREAPGVVEWQCLGCGARWNIRDHDTTPYAFWPPDVDRAFAHDFEPFPFSID